MEILTLKAERREALGTKFSRRLRTTGRLPGVIYGHGETPESFSVLAHDLELGLHRGARVVALDIGGQTQQYLIKSVQYDHLGKDPIHLDLARVDLNERVRVELGIEMRGTPKGVNQGGVLDQLMDRIEIECLALEIPDTLHPNVTNMELDQTLYVRDLQVPPGVTVLTDGDEKVAIVHVLQIRAEEAPVEGEAGPTEPERIGRVAPVEEEADEKKKS